MMRSCLLYFIAVSFLGLAGTCVEGRAAEQSTATPGESVDNAGATSAEEIKSEENMRPGITTRVLNLFRGSPDRIKKAGRKGQDAVQLEVKTSPETIKLGESRRMKVEIVLRNTGKRIVVLQFPTEQRFEMEFKNNSGAVVTKWSEDRFFGEGSSITTINPGEMVKYQEEMPLRELAANETYLFEVRLLNKDGNVHRQMVTPQP